MQFCKSEFAVNEKQMVLSLGGSQSQLEQVYVGE